MRKLLLSLCMTLTYSLQAQTLSPMWTSEASLRSPESVLFDASSNTLFVSSMDGPADSVDGKGFISTLGLDGAIKSLEWVSGLNAPKGLGLYKDRLYVADIDAVVEIDIPTATIVRKITIEGARFLNDITIGKGGLVYVSDSQTGKVHVIKGNRARVFMESKELNSINGLLAVKENLYLANFNSGQLFQAGKDKKLKLVGEAGKGADGIVDIGGGSFLVSSWYGEIYHINAQGISTKLLDTKEEKVNAADIEYDATRKILYVPTFYANTVMAYTLSY